MSNLPYKETGLIGPDHASLGEGPPLPFPSGAARGVGAVGVPGRLLLAGLQSPGERQEH